MNRILLLPLLFLPLFLLFFPLSSPSLDLERAEILEGHDYVVLRCASGHLEIQVGRDVIEKNEQNVYTFFSSLVDTSQIERIEIVPSPSGLSCRVLTYTGRSYSGEVEYCIALALRKEVPVYVHKELLVKEMKPAEGF